MEEFVEEPEADLDYGRIDFLCSILCLTHDFIAEWIV